MGAFNAPLRDKESIGFTDNAESTWERRHLAGIVGAFNAPLRHKESIGFTDDAEATWERRHLAGIVGAFNAPLRYIESLTIFLNRVSQSSGCFGEDGAADVES